MRSEILFGRKINLLSALESLSTTHSVLLSTGQSNPSRGSNSKKTTAIWRFEGGGGGAEKTLHGQIFFALQTAKYTKQVVFVFHKCKEDNLIAVTLYEE